MKIIGHRGAKGLAPENTLRAFDKAIQHHVDEIEFDVRVTKDGIPVLHHDPEVNTGDKHELIRNLTYAQLRSIDPEIVTFEEILQYIDSKFVLLVEIKRKEPTDPIVAVLHSAIARGYDTDTLLVGSFSQKSLRELHREFPQITKVVIERWSGVRAVIRAKQLGTKRLNMRSLWLWSGFLASMQRRGYQIAPYTMNDPAKVRKWQKYLYGVITDYPDRFEK